MTNPIQTVLDAEAKAQRQIDHEEQDAQARVRQAQQQARQIVNRNEIRTGKVAKRYEALCERDLAEKIDAMVNEAEMNLDQFTCLSETDRNQIIQAVFLSLSPPAFGEEKPGV
jgi:vacuolar-type H+-ATPase subunit H